MEIRRAFVTLRDVQHDLSRCNFRADPADRRAVGAIKAVRDAQEGRHARHQRLIGRWKCFVDFVIRFRKAFSVVARDAGDDGPPARLQSWPFPREDHVAAAFVVPLEAIALPDVVEYCRSLQQGPFRRLEAMDWGQRGKKALCVLTYLECMAWLRLQLARKAKKRLSRVARAFFRAFVAVVAVFLV